MSDPSPVLCYKIRKIRILQLNHPKPQNPINNAIRLALNEAWRQADSDPDVTAIVLTGGPSRSFSAGGDFVEVSQLDSPRAVQTWIDAILEMYKAILEVRKPVIMAVDGYAIGMGLQIALLGDWRVGSEDCQLAMSELKGGIACTIGACILEHGLGQLAATRIIYGSNLIGAAGSLQLGLIDDLVPTSDLLQRAVERAEQLGSYPAVPFLATKQGINAGLIEKLSRIALPAVQAHIASFGAGAASEHMRSILKH